MNALKFGNPLVVLTAFALLPLCAGAADGADRGKIAVFLLAGQSNMEGRADGTKLTDEEKRRLKDVQPFITLAFNREPSAPLSFATASPGIKKRFGAEQTFGPELFFGLGLADAMPGRRILLIKRSVGATSLYGRWNPDWTSEKAARMGEDKAEPLYPDFIAYVREVLSRYRKEEYELRAMLWVQGEADSNVGARGPEPAAAYGENLQNLIRRVRRDVGAPDLPFLMVEVGSGKVVDGMRTVASSVPNVTLIQQSTDPKSRHFFPKYEVGHYNYEGMKRIGSLLAEAYLARYGEKWRD